MQLVHEGVKFNCNLCGYTTSWSFHLKDHAKSVHDGFMHKCELCDYTRHLGKLTLKSMYNL